jgi:hypothetical protein
VITTGKYGSGVPGGAMSLRPTFGLIPGTNVPSIIGWRHCVEPMIRRVNGSPDNLTCEHAVPLDVVCVACRDQNAPTLAVVWVCPTCGCAVLA